MPSLAPWACTSSACQSSLNCCSACRPSAHLEGCVSIAMNSPSPGLRFSGPEEEPLATHSEGRWSDDLPANHSEAKSCPAWAWPVGTAPHSRAAAAGTQAPAQHAVSMFQLWARWPFTTTVLSRDTTGTLPLTHNAYKEHYASVAKGGGQFAGSPGSP